jgi:nicotinamidase-related amidase
MKSSDKEFMEYLNLWLAELPAMPADDVFKNTEKTAVLSVDMTNGFCKAGNLSSPRVAAIIPSVADLFQKSWDAGVRQFALLHDCHESNALEFDAFAEHAVCGTAEAEAVDEIKALPFYGQMTVLPKNSIDPAQNTGLDAWLAERPSLDTFVVVGDCTDICAYLLAIHLRAKANAYHLPWRVIVPEDCVATYDLPLESARQFGAMPHDGDLLHKVFLYHMALNGIEVVKSIR